MPAPVHVRTQIRRAVKALLRDLEAGHGNVFVGLSWPTGPDRLPCILITTPTENDIDETMETRRQARTVIVKIECRVSGNDDEALLDQLDEMARQVEDKLMAEVHADAGTLDALVMVVRGPLNTTMRLDATTETRKGQLDMQFAFEYATNVGDAATPLVA